MDGSHRSGPYLRFNGTNKTLSCKVSNETSQIFKTIHIFPRFCRQVGVNDQAISFLYASKAAGVTLACFTSGPAIGMSFMKSSTRKLILISISLFFTSLWLGMVPFIQDYFLLMTAFGFITYGIGSFDMMDNALMVSMLGSELSRPFVQSLHAFKAAGIVFENHLQKVSFYSQNTTCNSKVNILARKFKCETIWVIFKHFDIHRVTFGFLRSPFILA